MSLFGPSRPAGITKEEEVFVRGELMNAPFGHSGEKLTPMEVEDIMGDIRAASGAHTVLEMKYGWNQVDAPQAQIIEQSAVKSKKYSPAQLAHIHQVFTKYLTINKVKPFL